MKATFSFLILILVLRAIFIILILLFGGIGLGPDEAQYWTWSKMLDWGYYSKPPGIAWQIKAGTLLFGDTELGVRFFSLILGTLLSLATYLLAEKCYVQRHTAVLAAVGISLTPLGIFGSFFAITDVGLVLFWTLACVVIASSLSEMKTPNYYLLGLIILCGALFKWPIYLFWVLVIVFMFLYPVLQSPKILVGILISLLGLLPSVYWNFKHNWATFRHVSATVVGREDTSFGGNFLEFLGAQAALVSPLIFLILIFSFGFLFFKERKKVHPPLFFCGASALLVLVAFLALSVFKKVQGNWAAFVYPSSFVFLFWVMCESVRKGCIWLKIGIMLSVILTVFVLAIPTIQRNGIASQYAIPFKWNPFKHNLGWENLGSTLENVDFDPSKDFLFSDKYQMASELSFYGPQQKRAYFLNLHGIRNNQFRYWPTMAEEQIGKNGFFVLAENTPHLEKNLLELMLFYQEKLQKYFKKVELLGISSLFNSYGVMAKGALIYKCTDYNGLEPEDSLLY